jgi:hypothetical protein
VVDFRAAAAVVAFVSLVLDGAGPTRPYRRLTMVIINDDADAGRRGLAFPRG